ncbi:methylmalonyl-CoA mutase, small subunit [Bacillus methanolicus PB1]|uniref:methylmalonyl-CoA mutase n=1 Tax=Bacillus methanolicus PB1 TaxID=997296 RepID=I3DX23_BACMT|nr:methylmalonyl-CoA mutase subunit beta [Bacillus methanolicus]EIJ78794.1 methylmalonyl-CoA mutase, small subunit [Bacillus methanolicus PB1]
MTINEMKNEQFPAFSIDEWKEAAEKNLKGKLLDSLSRCTYENIKLKPLYSAEDEVDWETSQFPGFPDYRRGIYSLGYNQSEWYVAQTIQYKNIDELKTSLSSSLDKGQTSISFEVQTDTAGRLKEIIGNIYEKNPFSVNAKLFQYVFIEALLDIAGDSAEKITGFTGMDPIAVLAEQGTLPIKISELYDQWAELIKKADQNMPHLKTILVDTTPYHNGGASAVQELAAGLSAAVFHIQELLDRKLSLEKILYKIVFKFSIGANFFMEIAKLRAARMIWNKITEAYGALPENRKMIIAAETSKFTKTAYDPYVNLLRSGNEAFAAVLGGIQYLHVSPYNEPENNFSSFSDRIARNTQLILKEEAHLNKTVDPAGGSWYVEHLTNELAEKSWELFLQIEDHGGIFEALKSGWLQQQISEIREKRQMDVYTRKQSIIGTNIYANLDDKPLQLPEEPENVSATDIKETVEPIPQIRLSEPFEKLRRRSEQLADQLGRKPAIGLICLGALKQHKARADFITGFIAPGGIEGKQSGEINSTEQAFSFIKETGFEHYCLCGSNEQYAETGMELVREIKKLFPSIKLFLACLPDVGGEKDWRSSGIDEFIHVKSNCYKVVSGILEEMEARMHEE